MTDLAGWRRRASARRGTAYVMGIELSVFSNGNAGSGNPNGIATVGGIVTCAAVQRCHGGQGRRIVWRVVCRLSGTGRRGNGSGWPMSCWSSSGVLDRVRFLGDGRRSTRLSVAHVRLEWEDYRCTFSPPSSSMVDSAHGPLRTRA